MGQAYFHYWKSVDGDITNTPLAPSVEQKRIFYSAKNKVGSGLMCLFVEKLISF